MRMIWLSTLIALLLGGTTMDACAEGKKRELRDIIGSAHVAGKYCFSEQDYLNEGADRLLQTGSRVIKLWFTGKPQSDYPFNSDWPKVNSMVELAQTLYFRKVFAKPFTTFILETYPPSGDGHYFTSGMTPEQIKEERTRFYEFAKYLLTTYKGSGKTFVIQNWEGDWVLTNPQFTKEPDPVAIQGMIDWLNARQDGVSMARAEVGTHGVMVLHAAEANLVARAMDGKTTVTNDVIPYTHCDLYSYSCYDTCLYGDPKKLRDALDYLASKAPDSKLFGSKNIMIGEFGAPENEYDQLRIVKTTVETALDWGARYIVYWEVFCNEPKDKSRKLSDRPKNDDMRGFWLVRPDGTKPPVWDYFVELCKPGKTAL